MLELWGHRTDALLLRQWKQVGLSREHRSFDFLQPLQARESGMTGVGAAPLESS